MTKQLLEKLQRIKSYKIGKLAVVVLPLEDFERMKEDLEMMESRVFARKVAKARKEKKLYSSSEVKKALGIPA
jgi:PHD/YefM family antitoxin component YafN of YafNO toxin-antitoxin module